MPEITQSWADSVEASLSASLLLGRTSARSIAKAHLSELFKIVESDYDAALIEVSKVESFASRRLLLECFRLTFSLTKERPEYLVLLNETNLLDPDSASQYDGALLSLLRECGEKKEALAKKIATYPISKRRNAIQRLDHPDFQRRRRVRVSRDYVNTFFSSQSPSGPLKWWHWALLIVAVSAAVHMFNE